MEKAGKKQLAEKRAALEEYMRALPGHAVMVAFSGGGGQQPASGRRLPGGRRQRGSGGRRQTV